ncbi:hypothetical protein [Microbacterium rhizomatis]|uniref:Uncharacterized protein n=1 Tax=Microbacterium rhizomatis TaxID=1631477 RepID=A0A5J5J599_9MICO|nr:hypothetical protein [Microbacterium rhizomatis]KAA9111337.1 hypothetical protein F6B43_07055 [Microbacterium rhizomatis]
MSTSRRRLKAVSLTAICLTAALVVAGAAMTVYAVVGLERGSATFTAILFWAQACLIAGAAIGLGALLLRRALSRQTMARGSAGT